MAACAKKIKRENRKKKNKFKKGIHRQMIMDGGKGKKFKNCCVVENIEHQNEIREYNEIK